MSKKLIDSSDGVTHQIGFWTCNAEGPQQACDMSGHGDSEKDSCDDACMLVGGSVWGMIRSAALEIDFRLLSMICIDTDHILTTKDTLTQATQELIMPYWKSRMSTSEDGSDNAETEICYRGENRYVRRLCKSRSHIMGDAELGLHRRGRLDKIVSTSDSLRLNIGIVCIFNFC